MSFLLKVRNLALASALLIVLVGTALASPQFPSPVMKSFSATTVRSKVKPPHAEPRLAVGPEKRLAEDG